MNGHAGGERFGWLVAAVVAMGAVGFAGPAQHTVTLQPAAAFDAATTSGPHTVTTISDRYLGPAVGTDGVAATPDNAVASDAMGWPTVAPTVVAATQKPAQPRPAAPKPAAPKPAAIWWSRYHGTNHVWMPTLGISKGVIPFPCSRSTSPDNYVYRWGCAGRNNVYLLGHAYGVFKALHDAYYNGKLRVGMPVIYADGSGRTHLFRVTTWRVTSPADVVWAYSSQPRLSMTLQTCVGANSQYRLDVRLVAVGA